jgi:hypothetical protein
MDKICCVFVSNKPYLDKFKKTVIDLLYNGLYKNDIVLIIGDDFLEDELYNDFFFIQNKIKIVKFENIDFGEKTKTHLENIKTDGRNILKKFQWHKLHIFNEFFKKWDFILYLDCGMKIHSDINPVLDLRKKDKLIAHSDNFPNNGWDLSLQFESNNELFKRLEYKFNLRIDYPQTGLMLFDTSIISNNIFQNLLNLVHAYPISKTNEQAYIALYFTNILKIWERMPEGNEEKYYYHCFKLKKDKNYIITKYE